MRTAAAAATAAITTCGILAIAACLGTAGAASNSGYISAAAGAARQSGTAATAAITFITRLAAIGTGTPWIVSTAGATKSLTSTTSAASGQSRIETGQQYEAGSSQQKPGALPQHPRDAG